MPRVQITVRLERDPAERLLQLAHDTQMSANQVAVALLEHALRLGWTVTAASPVTVDDRPGRPDSPPMDAGPVPAGEGPG